MLFRTKYIGFAQYPGQDLSRLKLVLIDYLITGQETSFWQPPIIFRKCICQVTVDEIGNYDARLEMKLKIIR